MIVIDYTPAYEQGGGIGRYVRELTAALAQHDTRTPYTLFVAGAKQSPPPLAANMRWRTTPITPTWLARLWHRAHVPLPIQAFVGDCALYHATDFVLPPTLPRTPTLLTVHDLSFVRVPQAASPNLKAYLDAVVPRSVRRAAHVLADSAATKQDLIDLYGTPADKITVLLSGVEARFRPVTDAEALAAVRAKYQLGPRPYIFSIGTVQPRKNYSRLIRAVAELRARGVDVGVVIAGGKGWLADEMYQTIRETQMAAYVHLIGFADDADLPALYSGAAAVSFATLYEGFGFPVLEGMACGVPVVTANVSSLPEVAGDAALQIDPTDTAALVDALDRVLHDQALRAQMIARGHAQVARFTWGQAAAQLRAVYAQLGA
jgi:glycosyltransferase involved in cell wall biosynthesis